MMKIPNRLAPGDKVAILSPSSGLAEQFPWVYKLGLERLRRIFGLEPIEFPTARMSSEKLRNHPKARAEDLNAAFLDPSIKAVIATLGGNDQVRILPYLDKTLIGSNPKIFIGYSDNTNLHLLLWNLKVVSYYGGNLMTQFAMQGEMHDFTKESLSKALFSPSIGEIKPSSAWTDEDLPWEDPQNLTVHRSLCRNKGWQWWQHESKVVEGILWGGCLEVLDLHLSLRSYLPSLDEFENIILFVETSEEMPTEGFVYRFFAALGELGILRKIKALLVGRPKSQFCGKFPTEGREAFLANQKLAIKRALQDYRCDALTVFDMDIGHTDPQLIIPMGARAIIDGNKRKIYIL